MTAAEGTPALRVVELRKAFPGVVALDGVSMAVGAGEVRGLVGHNGAGKSTLVRILAGAERADEGHLEIDGEPRDVLSATRASELGIGVVHQQLHLVPNLTVADNFALLDAHGWWVDRRSAARRATESLEELGTSLDLSTRVADLSVPEQQLVAIARTLTAATRLLVLDEPTASLAPSDAEFLYGIVRRLAGAGRAVIFISHRLPEVLALCDSVTVLTQGRVVATRGAHELDEEEMIRLMVGRVVRDARPEEAGDGADAGDGAEVRFQDRHLQRDAGALSLRPGHVTGVFGLPGSGRDGLLRALGATDRRFDAAHPAEGRAAFVSGDRRGEGVFPNLTISEHIALGRAASGRRARLRSPRREAEHATQVIGRLGIQCRGPSQPVSHLSGGNQQKVVVARALEQGVDLLVLDEPTQGVDVASREDLHALLRELAGDGTRVVAGSADAEELGKYCDEIYVVHDGRVGRRFTPPFDEERLVLAASGGGAA